MTTYNSSLHQLLEITRELVLEKGCKHTTLQDIISKSGMSKGGIYHYVSSKDELLGLILKAAVEETNRRFNEAVTRAIEGGSSTKPFEVLAERIGTVDEEQRVVNEIFLYLLGQRENPKVKQILEDYYQLQYEMSVSRIKTGQHWGAVSKEIDAHQVAAYLQVFRDGLRIQHSLQDSTQHFSLTEIHDFLREVLYRTENKKGE